jgi:hypothetical protein
MKLDRTFAREIKALNGDGSREARFETLNKIRAANKELSTPEVRERFNDCMKTHGRAVTALCVASTLYTRRERLDEWGLTWALAVLNLWTNKMPSFIDRASIDDGLHPTRICEYAGSFIRLTTEE